MIALLSIARLNWSLLSAFSVRRLQFSLAMESKVLLEADQPKVEEINVIEFLSCDGMPLSLSLELVGRYNSFQVSKVLGPISTK